MIKVNLLSPERKDVPGAAAEVTPISEEERESKVNTGAAIGAAVLTVGLIGFLYITQSQTLAKTKKTLDEKKAKKVQLRHVENTLRELEKTTKDLNSKVNLIQQLKSRKESTVRMMDEISNALPEWVWLTSLGFSGNIVRLSGKALNNNLIANFINNLKATDSFTNVDFKKSSRKKQSGFEDIFTFSITCRFKEKSTEKKAG